MQRKLLKRLIEKILIKMSDASDPKEAYFEMLSANKELIELTEDRQEKLLLVNQAFRFMEKAQFNNVNLDFVKWIVSFAWNCGI